MKRIIVFIFISLLSCTALADVGAYGGIHQLQTKNKSTTFSHFNNWVWSSDLLNEPTLSERIFSTENDFSYVEAKDENNHILFHAPSPALSYIWISADSNYFVGLSNIKLRNQYQIVVWQRDGKLIYREHVYSLFDTYLPDAVKKQCFNLNDNALVFKCVNLNHPFKYSFSESVTNYIYWFNENKPNIRINETPEATGLLIRSVDEQDISIQIK